MVDIVIRDMQWYCDCKDRAADEYDYVDNDDGDGDGDAADDRRPGALS